MADNKKDEVEITPGNFISRETFERAKKAAGGKFPKSLAENLGRGAIKVIRKIRDRVLGEGTSKPKREPAETRLLRDRATTSSPEANGSL